MGAGLSRVRADSLIEAGAAGSAAACAGGRNERHCFPVRAYKPTQHPCLSRSLRKTAAHFSWLSLHPALSGNGGAGRGRVIQGCGQLPKSASGGPNEFNGFHQSEAQEAAAMLGRFLPPLALDFRSGSRPAARSLA
jgi:hypothetical protein